MRQSLKIKIYTIANIFIFPIVTSFIFAVLNNILRQLDVFHTSPFLFLFLITIVHSLRGGFISGVWAAAVSLFIETFFFTDPLFKLASEDYTFFEFFILFIQAAVVALIMSRVLKTSKALDSANKQISRSQVRLRSILDSVNAYIALLTPDGRIVEKNYLLRDFKDVKGTAKEARPGFVYETLPWASSKESAENLKNAVALTQTGDGTKYDDILKDIDGTPLHVTIDVDPIISSDGEREYVLISAIDITERKNYEIDLRRATDNYYKLIDSNIIGMIIGDAEGNIIEANKAFLGMIGYSEEEVHEKPLQIKDIISAEQVEVELSLIGNVITEGFSKPVQKEMFHRTGQVVPILISSVVIDSELNRYLAIVIDISEQKKLEKKKEEFISIVSHELKTPLTTLKGFVQLMAQSEQNLAPEVSQNYIAIMQKQITKLHSLISDLVDVTKIDNNKLTFNFTQFDIVKLTKEIADEVNTLNAFQNINFTSNKDAILVDADEFRIGQVITNFLTNAIKYSPENSPINVRLEDKSTEVLLEVEDCGTGIRSQELEHIFKKFYQIENQNRPPSSLGLGLFISANIIKNHNGTINATSTWKKGSTFYFTIPKKRKASRRRPDAVKTTTKN